MASPLLAKNANETGKEETPAAVTPVAAIQPKAVKPEPNAIESEVQDLRSLVEEQRAELEAQRAALKAAETKMEALEEKMSPAASQPAAVSAIASPAVSSNAAVKSISPGNESLKTPVATVAAKDNAAGAQSTEQGPASIRFKGLTITPGGFLVAESVYRTRATGADINTPFTGIPFPGNDASQLSEFNASGRQSRLSFLFQGQADSVKLTGYYEMDWLGACVTSNSRQSNSYCLRQRQLWGQGAFSNGWTVTGGQMWSLATETKKAMDNRTEALPMTIDAQYHVGFSWERQYGFRVTKSFNDKAWVGFAVEEPQLTLTNHNSPTPFLAGGVGSGGGLLNFADTTGYSANVTPDFIVKAAFEPGWGHYEIFGVVSNFRDRIYPCGASTALVALPAGCPGATPSASNAFNDTRTGGGVGLNFRGPITKQLDLGVHVLAGDGIGRYSSAQLPDVTVRPDGSLGLIRGGGALGTLEYHPTSKLDVYLNYGIEYADRAAYTYFTNAATPVLTAVGYGSPYYNQSGCEALAPLPTGSGPFSGTTAPAGFNPSSAGGCTGDIRNIQEATIGFWHKLYQGPRGGLRWGLQYSYIFKNTWSGNNNVLTAPGVNAKAIDNMIFTSFRYYIP